MAEKKASVLAEELKNLDMVSIINGGNGKPIFTKNDLVDFSYPTGIPLIDYPLGYEVLQRDSSGNVIGTRLVTGIQAGSFNVITGPTQSFKTLISSIICANIAYMNDGNIVHIDAENRLVGQRVKTMTKLPESWFIGESPRYSIKCGAIGFDGLQEWITEMWVNKMKFKDILLKDTGVKDSSGEPIILMPPTMVFLDSISSVLTNEYKLTEKKSIENAGELHSNTYGMINAKTIRGVLQDILPMLKEANINIITISHQNTNISGNAFAGPKKQFQYGAADVKIAGGKAVEYNASLVATFTGESSPDSRYHIDHDGFEGNTVIFEPTKCSTNESGNSRTGLGFRLVIDKRQGTVDNLRSLTLFLNEKGRLKGNKAGFRIVDHNGEIIGEKFTWKTIHEDFKKDPATYKNFMVVAKEELMKYVAKAPDVAGSIDPMDMDSIISSL